MTILNFVVGIPLLFLGRRLYWLFVAAIGLIAGLYLTPLFFHNLPDLTLIIISILLGVAGAILAIFIQRFAIFIAGFVAGGYLVTMVLHMFQLTGNFLEWVPFFCGGIFGAILVATIFDWALIFISSFMGSLLIAQTFNQKPLITTLIIGILFIIGVVIQKVDLKRQSR